MSYDPGSFATGENISVLGGTLSYSGTSQGAVNAGTYSIIPSGYTAENYNLVYVPGALLITEVPLGGNIFRDYLKNIWHYANLLNSLDTVFQPLEVYDPIYIGNYPSAVLQRKPQRISGEISL